MNWKNGIFLIAVLHASTALIQAQKINLLFPGQANRSYSLVRYWGTINDTISGSLDTDGSAQVDFGAYPYRGIASLYFSGGNPLQLVVNEKSFSVRMDQDGIAFKDSPENTFLKENYLRLSNIELKRTILKQALGVYDETSLFRDQLIQESKKQEAEHELFFKSLDESERYAAKYLKLVSYLNKYASISDQESLKELRQTSLTELDLATLYNSPLWKDVIAYWAGMQYNAFSKHPYFVKDAIHLIKQEKSMIVRDEFANSLIDIAEQYNWEDVKRLLGIAIYNGNLIPQSTRNLNTLINSLGVQIGAKPVDFDIDASKRLSSLSKETVLLLFYEDGCGHCAKEIADLKKHYAKLVKQGVHIVSITAENDDLLYNHIADQFPWENRINDKTREIPTKYGVFMSPTLFLIKEDKIVGRYASFSEIKELN